MPQIVTHFCSSSGGRGLALKPIEAGIWKPIGLVSIFSIDINITAQCTTYGSLAFELYPLIYFRYHGFDLLFDVKSSVE